MRAMTVEILQQWIAETSFSHVKEAMYKYNFHEPHALNSHRVLKDQNCTCSLCYAGNLLNYDEDSIKSSWTVVYQTYVERT